MPHSLRSKTLKQLSALAARKAKIERSIEQEVKELLPCSLTLQRLKKLRLRIKDHMTALRYWLDDRNFSRG
jgi:hypothetical protein